MEFPSNDRAIETALTLANATLAAAKLAISITNMSMLYVFVNNL